MAVTKISTRKRFSFKLAYNLILFTSLLADQAHDLSSLLLSSYLKYRDFGWLKF